MKSSFDKSQLSPNDITLGIIGGGQLGKMIGIEAKRMSLNLAYLDPDKTCPASTIADKLFVSDYKDEKSILDLAQESASPPLSYCAKYDSEQVETEEISKIKRNSSSRI